MMALSASGLPLVTLHMFVCLTHTKLSVVKVQYLVNGWRAEAGQDKEEGRDRPVGTGLLFNKRNKFGHFVEE